MVSPPSSASPKTSATLTRTLSTGALVAHLGHEEAGSEYLQVSLQEETVTSPRSVYYAEPHFFFFE